MGSDLDLVIAFNDSAPCPVQSVGSSEFYAKTVEYFVNSLSSMTRHGSLYRVDLRLRPDGKNGATSIGRTALRTYLFERAAVWEWLAYVKIRGVFGEDNLAEEIENMTRGSIHHAASSVSPDSLRTESYEMRLRLEKSRSGRSRSNSVNIKFGAGGLQDVYFAIRYLQLRDNIPDDPANRSTMHSLQMLRNNDSLSLDSFMGLRHGYLFLSELDHNLRLKTGRSNRLQTNDPVLLDLIAERMHMNSGEFLLAELTEHRVNIRSSFEEIFEA